MGDKRHHALHLEIGRIAGYKEARMHLLEFVYTYCAKATYPRKCRHLLTQGELSVQSHGQVGQCMTVH